MCNELLELHLVPGSLIVSYYVGKHDYSKIRQRARIAEWSRSLAIANANCHRQLPSPIAIADCHRQLPSPITIADCHRQLPSPPCHALAEALIWLQKSDIRRQLL
jgi:hypothetical protein